MVDTGKMLSHACRICNKPTVGCMAGQRAACKKHRRVHDFEDGSGMDSDRAVSGGLESYVVMRSDKHQLKLLTTYARARYY